MFLSELLASLLTSPPAGTMIWIRYTNSPLLTTITTLSCQPLQESTRLDSPLSPTSSTSSTSHTPQHSQKHTPNPHPYKNKTTSTALLTRSNSSSSQNGGRHYCVLLTRPASRSGESDSGISGEYQRKGKEHKYTKSLTDALSPLPYLLFRPFHPPIFVHATLILLLNPSSRPHLRRMIGRT